MRCRAATLVAIALVASLVGAQAASADHQVHERVSVYSPAGFTNPVATYAGSSADGARLFFSVAESGFVHGVIFERTANTTTLVSADEDGQPHPGSVLDVSGDGSSVFFEDERQLTSGDLDTSRDIYERSAGVTRMVSTGPADPQNFNTPYTPFFSDDGTHAVFATGSALVPEDQDGGYGDVYERIGNTIRLVCAPTGPPARPRSMRGRRPSRPMAAACSSGPTSRSFLRMAIRSSTCTNGSGAQPCW